MNNINNEYDSGRTRKTIMTEPVNNTSIATTVTSSKWGLTVSIPHFLAAVFAVNMKHLPYELMLPDITTMIPPDKNIPVHENLLSYLPFDFGDTIISGSIVYPKYPLKDIMFVVTNKKWVLMNNFQEILLSAPTQQTIFNRATEIYHFTEDMFTENFPCANIPQTTILAHHLPNANDILRKIEDNNTPFKPTTIFNSIPGEKHDPIKNWFTYHGDTIIQSTQFITTIGMLTVNTSVTGGKLAVYSATGVNPPSLTFTGATDTSITHFITELLPEIK